MGIWRYGRRPGRAANCYGRWAMGVDMGELRGTHVPVLLERCLELLAPALDQPAAVHVDFTLGLGGHAEAILERFPDVILIGLDRDTEALAHARHRLARFRARTHLVHAVYDELPQVLSDLGYERIHSGLFDLGVSSLQLDEADRGFAYAQDARLDMRMDQSRGVTAEEVVNGYEPGELVRILRQYGEEKFASADRLGDRAGAGERADHVHGAAGRAGQGRDPGRRAANGWKSREKNVSGVTY